MEINAGQDQSEQNYLEDESNILGWDTSAFQDDHHVIISSCLFLLAALLVLSAVLENLHSKLGISWFPEVGICVTLGIITGGMLQLSKLQKLRDLQLLILEFDPTIFYFALLPPIIFSSGYHLRRRIFYANFGAILSLAFLGTIITISVISVGILLIETISFGLLKSPLSTMETIAFATLISSTDPISILSVISSLKVDQSLFYLIFGESTLNDAIIFVLYKITCSFIPPNSLNDTNSLSNIAIVAFIIIEKFLIISLASSILGYLCGIIAALIVKSQSSKLKFIVPIFLLTIYIPFYLCEMLQLSGIVAALFSGISARRYLKKNLQESTGNKSSLARNVVSIALKNLSHIAENCSFILLGVTATSRIFRINVTLSIATVLLCVIGRAVSVYPLLAIVNIWRSRHSRLDEKPKKPSQFANGSSTSLIPLKNIHMVFFAGLRGVVAFSCAVIFPNAYNNREIVISTTTIVVMLSLYVLGGLSHGLVQYLDIPTNVSVPVVAQQIASPSFSIDTLERNYLYPHVLAAQPSPATSPSKTIATNHHLCFSQKACSRTRDSFSDNDDGDAGFDDDTPVDFQDLDLSSGGGCAITNSTHQGLHSLLIIHIFSKFLLPAFCF